MKSMLQIFSRKEWVLVLALTLLKVMLHFYFNVSSGLHRDEYLYLAFSDHLDWGYLSVPPFIGIISFLVDLVSVNSNFWARFFPTLAGGVSVVLIAIFVKEMGGKSFAIATALLAFILSPVYLRIHSLMQPVAFDQLFWLISMFCVFMLLKTRDTRFWYAIIISWAIGFLNKYLVGVLIISTLGAVLISDRRKLLISKHFILGGIIGLLVVLPNIYWQYLHNWPVLFHLGELKETQLIHVNPIDFLSDQLVMNIPFVLPMIFGLISALLLREQKELRFIAVTFLFIIAILLVTHGKNYYTFGYYPVVYALCAVMAERYFRGAWKFLRHITLLFIILLSLPVIPLFSMPFLGNDKIAGYIRFIHLDVVTRWEDGEQHAIPQDFADMTGWPELSEIVIDSYLSLSEAEKKGTVIYANNYGQAGSVKYFGAPFHLPEPICFNDNFLLWAPDQVDHLKTLIYINHDTTVIRQFFKDIRLAGRVSDKYFREGDLPVYICRDPIPEYYDFYRKNAEDLKGMFREQ